VIVLHNKNDMLDMYQNKIEGVTHKVKEGAETLGSNVLSQMEDLGHKAISGTEVMSSKAMHGMHNIKEGTQKIVDKTLQGVEHLEERMKHKQ